MGLQLIRKDHHDREVYVDPLISRSGHFVEQRSVGRVQAWISACKWLCRIPFFFNVSYYFYFLQGLTVELYLFVSCMGNSAP